MTAESGTEPTRADRAPFFREHATGASTLVVAFSSLGVDAPDKQFEFAGLLDRGDCSILLLRDIATSWYHQVPGCPGIQAFADFLAERVLRHRHVIFLGYSMGGYAALLFGRMLGVDEIFALAPQTLLTPVGLAQWGDVRWTGLLERLHRGEPEPAHFDLARLFADTRYLVGQAVTIAVGHDAHDLDTRHAERLAKHARVVRLGESPIPHSGLVVGVRESGILRRAIDHAVRGEPIAQDMSGQWRDWMELSRYDLQSVRAEPETGAPSRLRIEGVVEVTGPAPLDLAAASGQPVRLGARLWRGSRVGVHGDELRFDFSGSTLDPGKPYPFAFEFEFGGHPAGQYEISVSLIREGRFWHDDLGFSGVTVKLEAHPLRVSWIGRTRA